MKTVWIVGGGMEAIPGIRRTKEMGFYVVVSDGNPEAPGFRYSDDMAVVSTYDIKGTVEAVKRFHRMKRPIDGIIGMATDVPLTVANAASELGLPGISVESARLSSDKLAMKRHFDRAGIPIPWFSAVESVAHLKKILKERGYPLVMKPVDSRGARGVLRLIPGVSLEWAFESSRSYSPTSRVMVEEYLEGPQISTESVLLDGKGYSPGFADRNYELLEELAPYMIENGGQQPSFLKEPQRRAIKTCAERAALAMGIETGVAKGDLVLTSNGPKVIEMAARLSGGWFSSDQIPLGTGVDLVGSAVRLAVGEEVTPDDVVPRMSRGVAIRYFFPRPGRVRAVSNVRRAGSLPGVHRLVLNVKNGDDVKSVTDHTQRAGFVITTAETREQAVLRAVRVIETVGFEISPS